MTALATENLTEGIDLLAGPVRQVVVAHAAQNDLGDPQTAWGRCAIESDALRRKLGAVTDVPLRLLRIMGDAYTGRQHWALLLWDEYAPEDSVVVDVTARQFDAAAPYPYVGRLIFYYDDACDWLNDHIEVEVYGPDALDVGAAVLTGEPEWTDAYGRDDHEPGDLIYPWDRDVSEPPRT